MSLIHCHRVVIAAVLPALLALAGCSDYLADYYYRPRPALVEVPATRPEQPPAVSSLASVIGVHKANANLALPQSVQIRLRLENTGSTPGLICLDPASLQLTTGDLVDFARPLLRPEIFTGILQLGQPMVFDAFFPFPPGHDATNTRLDSLQLKWVIQVGDRHIHEVVDFRRALDYYYYEPTWDPYWNNYYEGYSYWGYPHYGVYGPRLYYRR